MFTKRYKTKKMLIQIYLQIYFEISLFDWQYDNRNLLNRNRNVVSLIFVINLYGINIKFIVYGFRRNLRRNSTYD